MIFWILRKIHMILSGLARRPLFRCYFIFLIFSKFKHISNGSRMFKIRVVCYCVLSGRLYYVPWLPIFYFIRLLLRVIMWLVLCAVATYIQFYSYLCVIHILININDGCIVFWLQTDLHCCHVFCRLHC
jgi:hypothetical protein